MTLSQEMMKQYMQKKQLEELRERQKQQSNPVNILSEAIGLKNKINNLGNGLNSFGMRTSQSSFSPIANLGTKAQGLGSKLQAFGNSPQLTGGIVSNVGDITPVASEGTSAIGSAIGKAVPSATSLAGTGGAGLSSVAGAAGKAAPFLGAGISGAQAAQDASKGDYIGAGLNGIAAGASFVPGVGTAVAMGAQALDKVNKMFRAAKDKANAKAMQQSMEELQKSEKANEESLAGLQDTFQNDSEQAAQNMTLPTNNQTLHQDMMSQINPNYISSASGSPTGFASGINTPDETQTLQNDQSIQPQIEDVNGNVSAFPTTREAFAKSLTDNGWTEDVVNSALQGLNGGNKDMADYISAYNNNAPDDQKIAIPQTNEEIELARNGQFYQPQGNVQENNTQLKETLLDRIKNGLGQFKAGYEDNSLNGFADGDLANKLAGNTQQPITPQDGVLTGGAAQTKKTLMNRIGEAAGTGRRLMANPWTQAVIAGLVSKADGGDIGDIATAAYQYGTNKAKADDYYRKMNPDAKVMPVFNNYTADDYKAKAYNDFNQGRTMISRRDLIKLNNPTWSDAKIDAYISGLGIDGDEMISLKGYDSVQKANYNTGKLEKEQQKIDDTKEYRKGQLEVSKGRAAETARHNRVYEGQRGQSIANTKANNDRNYNLKVKQHQQKIQKEVESGNMVRIKAPNGEIKYIPKDKVNAALAAGGTRL